MTTLEKKASFLRGFLILEEGPFIVSVSLFKSVFHSRLPQHPRKPHAFQHHVKAAPSIQSSKAFARTSETRMSSRANRGRGNYDYGTALFGGLLVGPSDPSTETMMKVEHECFVERDGSCCSVQRFFSTRQEPI
ncbi:hypothetical protein GOODEAATRI_026464 [Goodea atripinnis]|uniref:Uncharacterized protein n=1 Tax=Goodea atripinnis TaxID=208336 RepID=A0ABV0MVB6_9TELE